LAALGFIGLAIMLFCLKFTGFIGTFHQQRTAIEAAALAAAKDLSAIVIDDPNFGLVGLSDSSPTGTATVAGDGYYTPVTGINTLFGTIRLDMIISDYLQDPLMNQLAVNDYKNALVAQRNLVKALNNAIAPGGTGNDINGNVLNPTQDAINAYSSNSINVAIGQSSKFNIGSMVLSLGYVNGLCTRTPIPQPSSVANVPSDQQSQGFYLPNVPISYDNKQFVFAALGPNASLVDYRLFQTTVNNAMYSTPTVVQISADELYTDSSNTTRIVHAVAAALPGTIVDQRPNPGAFTITFVNGPVPEIVTPGDLINNSQIQSDPTDLMQSPPNGDYPQTALADYSMPFLPDPVSDHPQFQHVFSVALYDWIKRGGTNINVQSFISMLETPIAYAQGGPQMQRYHLTSSGAVTNDSISWSNENLCVSNDQFRALSGLGLVSTNGHAYDLQITDFVRQSGRINGGLHSGEPLDLPGQTGFYQNAPPYPGPNILENTTWPYLEFFKTTSGALRPTYMKEGIAMDFTIRMRY
jgi:hypothetical protein